MLTRIFKSGNSLAVRIPKELGFVEAAQDVEIERQGDAIVIRPVVTQSLADALDAFAAFPPGFMVDGREFHEQKEREYRKGDLSQMGYMLDTNICIHLMQRQPPSVAARFKLLKRGDVVMSAITFAELRHGVERDPAQKTAAERALVLLLTHIPALSFDSHAAIDYGVLASAVRDRRRDALDRLIAAHALSLSLTLVTNNENDFKDYPGLKVENWVGEGN